MNLFTLYYANLNWYPWDEIEVIVGAEEKGKMTFKQAIEKYKDREVMWFCKTGVWLKAKSEE